MHHKTKHSIRDKARLTYGLTLVLKDDIDMLRSFANDYDVDRLYESVRDVTETLDKLVDIIAQLECTLYLEKLKG